MKSLTHTYKTQTFLQSIDIFKAILFVVVVVDREKGGTGTCRIKFDSGLFEIQYFQYFVQTRLCLYSLECDKMKEKKRKQMQMNKYCKKVSSSSAANKLLNSYE